MHVYYSQFVRNAADYGGAISGGDFSFVEIVESLFEENKATISVSGWLVAKFWNYRAHISFTHELCSIL